MEVDLAKVAVPMSDGSWVSTKVARVAELIAMMDANLEVRWVPPARRQPGDDAFRIIEHTSDGREHLAFSVATEAEFDERVLERIFLADNHRANVFDRLEAQNAAVKVMEAKAYLDELEEARDLARTVLASPLHSYTHDGIRYDKPNGGRP